MRYGSISAIGDFTALNGSAPDYLALIADRCSGGDSATLRTEVEDAPGTPGALVQPPLYGAQYITLGGQVIITSSGTPSGYLSAIDTLIASLKSALDSLTTAPDDLVHSGGTLSVWLYGALDTGWEGTIKTVTFSVVVDG